MSDTRSRLIERAFQGVSLSSPLLTNAILNAILETLEEMSANRKRSMLHKFKLKGPGKMPGIKKTMDEWKAGQLRSGSKKGPVVKSQKQAVAIGLSEERKAKGQRTKRLTGKKL